ncbi:MAG: ATP-dependent Clp protease adaptor ClpS [Polyangiales bacterium]
MAIHLDYPTTQAAHAALQTASAISHVQRNAVMLPEALLLALLCDPAVDELQGPIPEEEALRRALLASDETGDKDSWTARARKAYDRAWQRALTREQERPVGERVKDVFRLVTRPNRFVPVVLVLGAKLTVGDLLFGLAGSGALVDETLRARRLDPKCFDDDPEPKVGYPANLPEDALVDVIAVNDDVTPMQFVVELLEKHFGHSQVRALYLTYRIHQSGRARIRRCTRIVAEKSIDAALDEARAKGHPLAFVYGPRN